MCVQCQIISAKAFDQVLYVIITLRHCMLHKRLTRTYLYQFKKDEEIHLKRKNHLKRGVYRRTYIFLFAFTCLARKITEVSRLSSYVIICTHTHNDCVLLKYHFMIHRDWEEQGKSFQFIFNVIYTLRFFFNV